MSVALKQKNESLYDQNTVMEAVLNLEHTIREKQYQIEQERQLPDDIVNSLKRAGVFRMTMPKDWGGLELDPIEQLHILEALSCFDASVGWCAMIGCDGGFYSGFIAQDKAREIFSDVDTITASALTATGKAEITDNGFIVDGRWPFVSGAGHSDWFVLGCKIFKNNEQQFLPNGTPKTLQCFVPAGAVTILDTWYSTGLRGSGSNDITVTQCVIPKEQTFTYQNLSFYRNTPLYSFPLNIILNFSSIPLGVAQNALDEFLKSGDRPSRVTHIDGNLTEKKLLRDEVFVQEAVGKASASLKATRLYLYSCIEEIWACIQATKEIPPETFAQFQILNTYVYESCTAIVESLYKVRGGSAVYQGNTLDRSLRDLLTMNQHVMNSLRSYSMGGRVLLGLPPEMILL